MAGQKPIGEIRAAFHIIHRVATGQSDRAFMSIPADPERDADLIVASAIDELEQARTRIMELEEGLDVAADALLSACVAVSQADNALRLSQHERAAVREALERVESSKYTRTGGEAGAFNSGVDLAVDIMRNALKVTPSVPSEHSPRFACGRCGECDGGRGSDFCLFPRGGHAVTT